MKQPIAHAHGAEVYAEKKLNRANNAPAIVYILNRRFLIAVLSAMTPRMGLLNAANAVEKATQDSRLSYR